MKRVRSYLLNKKGDIFVEVEDVVHPRLFTAFRCSPPAAEEVCVGQSGRNDIQSFLKCFILPSLP